MSLPGRNQKDYLEITDDQRPVLVGERTNVIGSRKFKDLIVAGKFEEAAEVAHDLAYRLPKKVYKL